MLHYGFAAEDVVNEGRITSARLSLLKVFYPALTVEQLVLFSLSCHNELENTKKTIESYLTTKNGCPSLFTNRNLLCKSLQEQLKVVEFCIFPVRTEDGCVIVLHRLQDPDFKRYNMESAMKLLFMTLDAAIYDYPPTGLFILFDMKGVGLLHLTRVKLGMVKIFFQYLQEALPVRLRAIHVFNSVYFLEKVISIIKPFINKEVMEMVHFHPPNLNMEHFYTTHLSRERLPEDFGGSLSSVRVMHHINTKKLENLQSFFEEEEAQRTNL